MTERLNPTITAGTDYARVIQILEALVPDPVEFHVLRISGEPRSKARPRFSGGKHQHVYTSEKQFQAERLLSQRFRAAFEQPFEGTVAVACVFVRSTRGRIDTDNLVKHVLDAGTGTVWFDDCQATIQCGVLELDADNPRTLIGVAPYEGTMQRVAYRAKICEQCGKKFKAQFHRTRFCSRRCSGLAQQIKRRQSCLQCGRRFTLRKVRQRYCTHLCALQANAVARATITRLNRICEHCGGPVSRREYHRCRDCYTAICRDPKTDKWGRKLEPTSAGEH